MTFEDNKLASVAASSVEPGPAGYGNGALQLGAAPAEDQGLLPPILIQYWHTALRWRLLIAGIVAGCLVIGLIATLLMPPRYTAKTQLEINREQKNVTKVEGVDSQQSGRELEFYATQYALLKSLSLAERVAKTLNLANRQEFFDAHGVKPAPSDQPVRTAANAGSASRSRRERQVTGLLLQSVGISPVRTSSLVDITYTSRSPQLSATIANTWVREFVSATMDRQFASTADARKFLEGRLNELRARLEQSERDVVNYASDKGIVTLDMSRDSDGKMQSQRTLAATDLEALNQALVQARSDRIAAESRLSAGPIDTTPDALRDDVLRQLKPKRAELAAEYAKILTQFEPAYPAARAIKNQLDSIDATIAREIRSVNSSNHQAFGQALARERDLDVRVNALKAQFEKQRHDSIQFSIYQREADTNRQLYDALLQRYKEIGVAGVVGANNILVVDPAQVPATPSSPNLPLNLALALLIGVVLAAATVFGLEQIDEGIRNPAEVESRLSLPLLGTVPMIDGEPQAELLDPKSYLSEAYLSVRATLALATSHGFPKTLAVTSSQPSEGKTSTALALAMTIGRTNRKVLLIDADMRSPSVHKLVGHDNVQGLSNLLAGEGDIESVSRKTNLPMVTVISAGPTPPSAAELLSTDRLSLILAQMQQRYDHIVIDSPPVIGLADALLLARAVEGCVYVIQAERESVRTIRNALNRLRVGHNHVFGAIVTKVNFSRYGFRYGYGYGYGYGNEFGYGEGDKKSAKAEAA